MVLNQASPYAGTHIQTGEEVGIKLVRDSSYVQCMLVLLTSPAHSVTLRICAFMPCRSQ